MGFGIQINPSSGNIYTITHDQDTAKKENAERDDLSQYIKNKPKQLVGEISSSTGFFDELASHIEENIKNRIIYAGGSVPGEDQLPHGESVKEFAGGSVPGPDILSEIS